MTTTTTIATANRGAVRRHIEMAETADAYDSGRLRRPEADPLGMRGLPVSRVPLDSLVNELCRRIHDAGTSGIAGKRLAADMGLRDTRALRLLVAYARVHRHLYQIVGIPGSGYVWGEADRDTPRAGTIYKHAIRDATRRGRCYLYIASLHRREGIGAGVAQMVMDWMSDRDADGERHGDELAAMLAIDGSTIADVLDELIARVAATPGGPAALAGVAQRHRDVLLPRDEIDAVVAALDAAKARLVGASRRSA